MYIKILPLALLFAILAGCNQQNDNSADDGLPPVASWQLIWSDEFDGAALDSSKWEVQIGDGLSEGVPNGWGNNELQYYTEDNVTVTGGNLVITSRADNPVPDPAFGDDPSYTYSSGRIRTQGKFDFTYGRVEARIKLPATKGLWNAFWLLGSQPSPYGFWPSIGEIDILEKWVRGNGSTTFPFVSGAIHYGADFPLNRFVSGGISLEELNDLYLGLSDDELDGVYTTLDPGPYPDFTTDFHTYAVEWDAEEIRWYVDGFNFYSVRATDYWSYFSDVDDLSPPDGVDSNARLRDTIKYSSPASEGRRGFQAAESENAPFDALFHIILNTAVGGNLPDGAGEFPTDLTMTGDEMLVDYVRVYQCSLAERGGALCKNNETGQGVGRTGVALLDDPIDPSKKALPNFSRDFLLALAERDSLFSSEFDLYVDGPDAEVTLGSPALEIEAFNGASWSNETDPGTGNSYIRMTPGSNAGARGIGFVDPTGEELVMSGFPNGLGDFKFDLYVENPIDCTAANPNQRPILRVAIISGDAFNEGDFLFVPLCEIPVETWQRFTIPIQYLISDGNNLGAGGANLGAIKRLIEFAVADVNLRFDNVGFACGGQPCGIVGEVPVYTNSVDPLWDRGIVADDTFERFRVPSNADYTDPDCCHVQWEEIDTAEPGYDTVVQTSFGTTGTEGAVNFIGSSNPFPSIAALRNGEFRFDIRMISNPNDVELLFKIDANVEGQFSSTGEQPLGDLPIGQWRTFRCPITTLEQQGLDTTRITAPFVLVPGNRGAGQGVVVQWDNVTFATESTGAATQLDLPFVFDSLPGFCLPVAPFGGGAFAIVDNPGPDATNNNTRVGQIRKFDTGGSDAIFGGVTFRLSNPITFNDTADPTGKAFTIKTYSSRVGLPVTFKLESNSTGDLGRVFETTVADQWEEFTIDFNGTTTNSFDGITVILDNGVVGDGGDDFRLEIDEVFQVDSTSLVADLTGTYNFDAANTQYPLTDFGEARSGISTGPDGDPGNDGLMGAVTLNDFALTVNGTIVGGRAGFPNAIPIAVGQQRIRARIWTPQAGTPVSLKIEDSVDQFQFDEDTQVSTVAGWNTMFFDFSDANVADSFEKLIIVFNPGGSHNGETYYFDDLVVVP